MSSTEFKMQQVIYIDDGLYTHTVSVVLLYTVYRYQACTSLNLIHSRGNEYRQRSSFNEVIGTNAGSKRFGNAKFEGNS